MKLFPVMNTNSWGTIIPSNNYANKKKPDSKESGYQRCAGSKKQKATKSWVTRINQVAVFHKCRKKLFIYLFIIIYFVCVCGRAAFWVFFCVCMMFVPLLYLDSLRYIFCWSSFRLYWIGAVHLDIISEQGGYAELLAWVKVLKPTWLLRGYGKFCLGGWPHQNISNT